MHVKLLIDEIVRQTTVLIAQISTAAGVRAPLASIADQVFIELAKELEAQGVRRTVVADMFGLALRSYQLKFQRLSETIQPQTSLWQEIHQRLEGGVRTKLELQEALPLASSGDLTTVLNDLVASGQAFVSGRGISAVYGLTTEKDLKRLTEIDERHALAHWIWQIVATGRVANRPGLFQQIGASRDSLEQALDDVLRDGRVTELEGTLSAQSLEIPVGADQGWEAAVSDHYRALVTAIGAKLRYGKSVQGERLGGGTYAFTVHSEHPHAGRVYSLLTRLREDLDELWNDVSSWNKEHPPPKEADKVTFYFGQSTTGDNEAEGRQAR